MALPSNNPFSLGRRFLKDAARRYYSAPEVIIVYTPDVESFVVSIFDTFVSHVEVLPRGAPHLD